MTRQLALPSMAVRKKAGGNCGAFYGVVLRVIFGLLEASLFSAMLTERRDGFYLLKGALAESFRPVLK